MTLRIKLYSKPHAVSFFRITFFQTYHIVSLYQLRRQKLKLFSSLAYALVIGEIIS